MTGSVTGIRRRRGVAGRRETPHLPLDRDFYGQTLNMPRYTNQFSYFVVLEKEPSSVETLGPNRLALWFISGDGVATYDAVYANENAIPPFVFVHQDHGFGGNYTNFGNDGLLHAIAEQSNVYPRFILHGQGGTGRCEVSACSHYIGHDWYGESL